MVAEYKRKRLLEENTLDIKPKKIGIKLEGSERNKAKKKIRKELDNLCQEKNRKNKD